uniref:Uncharacterized protein n=1 Tax=Lactuca sativa TaxID=4236 RepID=A0A9R1VHK2_LACSA|nr:hypothetical protein LSAT_V11C500273910 [Lactuca sativa]
MSGVYDRFNKGLSNGIRAFDTREEMIAKRIDNWDEAGRKMEDEEQQQSLWIQQQEKAREEMKIIQQELQEMVKKMKIHRQNQIKREEETKVEIAKWKKIYHSEEGMEAEKAKWKQLYYSTLEKKEDVVRDSHNRSPPQHPRLTRKKYTSGRYESRKENEMKNLGGKVAESESKPKKAP